MRKVTKGNLWHYRIDNYRITTAIQNKTISILISYLNYYKDIYN